MIETIRVKTPGQGLLEITAKVEAAVEKAGLTEGLCTVFLRHTSASLIIQENADPSAKYDLEQWINRHIPDSDPHYTHTFEGADDMPSHIKTAITASSIAIPISHGRLALGTWQGIYLWEHRVRSHTRELVLHIGS